MQSETSWRGILDRISRSAELSDLLRRQSDVEAAQDRFAVAQSQAEQIQVTDESLQRIRQAAEIADQANARLRVAATRISFDIPSDRLAGIEADGAPLTDPPATVEAVEPVVITIPERGRILIEPAVADRDQLLRAEREARAELHAALSEVGANTLVDAQILRDQRRDLEATASAARQELDRLAPPGRAPTLQPRIDELHQALEALPVE
jgi:LPS O-antigen subunit length determinant protein (WzzB/FepE family)